MIGSGESVTSLHDHSFAAAGCRAGVEAPQ